MKRSTKQTDRNKATAIAIEYERAEDLARADTLTEAQCRKVLSDILERTTGESLRQPSVDEAFTLWLANKESKKSPNTAARYAHTLDLFQKHLGARAKRPLGSVAARDVQSFLDARLKAGLSSKSVSIDCKTLSAVFNNALKQGTVLLNPVGAVELPTVESSERETFTSTQVQLLLHAIEEAPLGGGELGAERRRDWRTAILLGYYLGARLRDCVEMRWDSVDLAARKVEFIPQKTKRNGKTQKSRKVIIPLHPCLEKHLEDLAASDSINVFICPALAEKDSGGAHGLSQTFKAIMRAAGIDSKTRKGQGTRQFSALSFHSLRHSFNSALANAGVDQEVRMKLTGHKTVGVNDGYTHHELAPLQAAIGKLPALIAVRHG